MQVISSTTSTTQKIVSVNKLIIKINCALHVQQDFFLLFSFRVIYAVHDKNMCRTPEKIYLKIRGKTSLGIQNVRCTKNIAIKFFKKFSLDNLWDPNVAIDGEVQGG